MKPTGWLLIVFLALALCGCSPAPRTRDESLAVVVLSKLRENEAKDDRPYFLTLKSVSGGLGPDARRRVIANIQDAGHRFTDALVVDPKSEFKWSQELRKYRSVIAFEVITWVSDKEVILKMSNSAGPLSGGRATIRLKKVNGEWQHVETIESWVS